MSLIHSPGQATFFAWANDALRYEEDSLRAVVLGSMNAFSNATNAWWSIVFYSANYAPAFTRGAWAMVGTSLALVVCTAGLTYLCVRTERKRETLGTARDEEVYLDESQEKTKLDN